VPVNAPSQWDGISYTAIIQVRVRVDASGVPVVMGRGASAISDIQPASGAPNGIDVMNALFDAASQSIQQWRYDPPQQAPIEFAVAFTFKDGQVAGVTQSNETQPVSAGPAGVRLNGTFVGAGPDTGRANTLAFLQNRLSLLRTEGASLAQRLGERHPDRVRNRAQIAAVEAQIDSLKAALQAGATTRTTGPGATTRPAVRIGGSIGAPARVKFVPAAYSPVALRARVSGIVIVEATIDEQGRVAEARILRSIPLLDQAALDAVRQWEYTPTLLNGSPVPVIMTVTVNFTLTDNPPQ
jgi:protein TonB